MGTVNVNAAPAGRVLLDSFSGANDDAKLTAALSYASAQTYTPFIQLQNRSYSFATARTLFSGFKLIGPGMEGVPINAELSAVNMPCQVNISTAGNWMSTSSSDDFDCFIGDGIGFVGTSQGSSGATTFLGSGGGQFHCSSIHNVAFHNLKTVLGTQSTKLLMTACDLGGFWNIAGCFNGSVHIGGSDNRLWMNGLALWDASQAYNTGGGAAGQFHIWVDGLDNSVMGPGIYITAAGLWGGIKVSGPSYNGSSQATSTNGGVITMYGITNEGQNASTPCDGALLRIEGGIVKWHGGTIYRAMSNPSAMGHSPADAGAVHVESGGSLIMRDVTYDRYTGQAETVPFVYSNTSAPVVVQGTTVNSEGGVWSGLPRVHTTQAGPPSNFITDALVTVV